jgi:phage-related holin
MGGEEMFNGFQIFIESLLSRVSDMPWWAVFILLFLVMLLYLAQTLKQIKKEKLSSKNQFFL